MTNCEICGADSNTRYKFRYPNSDNKDTTKLICKDCHESLRVIINEFIDSVESLADKTEGYYPVIYPDTMNKEAKKYIAYTDYKNLEKEINTFIENGGV